MDRKRAGSRGGGPPPPREGELPLGTMLCNRYRLERVIGRGGSAVVYQGRDMMLSLPVAVKVLLPHGINFAPGAAANGVDFRTEAVAAMRLSHPNILRVYNYERDGEHQCLVMEYIPGENSHRVCARQPGRCLPVMETIRIGLECLDALDHAHSLGVLHHDVKPSNILLTRAGSAKLCDFGLAHLAGRQLGVQPKGFAGGTPGFISPERVRGEPGDERSDIYSLGATLYALGNGGPIFRGTPREVFRAHMGDKPPPLSPVLPPLIDEILQIALSARPTDRFKCARDMRKALAETRRELSLTIRARKTPPPVPPPGRRPMPPGANFALDKTLRPDQVPASPRAIHPAELAAAARSLGGMSAASLTGETTLAEPPAPAHGGDPLMPMDVSEIPSLEVSLLVEAEDDAEGERSSVAPAAGSSSTRPGMAWIPTVRFDSVHAGKVRVPGFLLDVTPVTNRAFLAFVEATGERPPAEWGRTAPSPDVLDLPVVGVDLARARRYAEWIGKRLPTCLEWEAAARRPDGRAFPWGEEWERGRVNVRGEGPGKPTPVEANPGGATVDGCLDLVGNVWEWTEVAESTRGPEPGYAWVFGGSYRHPGVKNGAIARTSVLEMSQYPYLGFRCAVSG